MSFSSNPSGLFSHPERYLEDHLLSVASDTYRTVGGSLIAGSPYTQGEVECIKNTSYLIGLLHDFGKATKYFQDYLQGKKVDDFKKHHSLLSSIVTFNFVSEYLERHCSYIDTNLLNFLKVVSYILVKDHHSDLDDFLNELSQSDFEQLKDLVNSIDNEKLNALVKNLNQEIPLNLGQLNFDKQELFNFIERFESKRLELKSFLRSLTRNSTNPFQYYFLTNLMFSSLLESDKVDAAVREEVVVNSFVVKEDGIKKYKETLPRESDISTIREQVFRDAERNFQEIINKEPIPRVFFVTLPTGLGKTLIGFNLANILRNKIISEQSIYYRIIYALPFINIIDQNAQTIEDILRMQFREINTDLLLKHHHLSEISYKTEEKFYDTGAADILMETWQSNIIVTTFVQLFHTLISNKSSMLMKFNKLSHSIIILDEVQAIPLQYWRIIDKLLYEALEKLDSYAIIMTATKPILFSNGIDVVQAPQIGSRYILDANTYFGIQSMEEFLDKFEIKPDKSYMFVLNTIEEAKKFYKFLSQRIVREKLTFLSSHVVPKERLNRVKEIKQGKYKFLVTTQIVEAGVDIDFDVVVRDFAPLDSVIQSAGRCNRNFIKEQGIVYVTKLRDEKRFYSSYIYDKVLLEITEQLIKGKTFYEDELYKVFDEYENLILKKKDTAGISEIIEEAIKKLKYDSEDGLSEFSIIEKTYPVMDVFVEVDDFAKEAFKKFENILSIENRFDRHNEFKRIKRDFYSYVISVPATVQNRPPIVNGIPYVSMNSLNEFYDKNTGFITNGVNAIW
jgi:CRISPR-associated endonuclease/helicase Cas3